MYQFSYAYSVAYVILHPWCAKDIYDTYDYGASIDYPPILSASGLVQLGGVAMNLPGFTLKTSPQKPYGPIPANKVTKNQPTGSAFHCVPRGCSRVMKAANRLGR